MSYFILSAVSSVTAISRVRELLTRNKDNLQKSEEKNCSIALYVAAV